MPFSDFEKRDMLKCYYMCNRNSQRASDTYEEQFPERVQPHRSLFQKLDRNLEEFGSLKKARTPYGNKITQNENDAILNQVRT